MEGERVGEIELRATLWVPHEPARVWTVCSTKTGLEGWWSPKELRTRVLRWELRRGGGIVLRVRYLPALLTPGSGEAFRAAGVPVVLTMRGSVREVVEQRRMAFGLALDLGSGGDETETVTTLELTPEGSGTRITVVERGAQTPHGVALGPKILEGRLDRIARALEPAAPR